MAAIAFRLLPPEKAAALDNLLRTQIGVSFIDASGYADDVIRPADGDWHFVDWPLDRPDYDPVFCRSNHHEHCVVEELPRQVGIGRLATDPREQALALSWVLHLVGDLHQPLHVADRGDGGGNGTKVRYRHEPLMKLHAVWDDRLVSELAGERRHDELAVVLLATLGAPSTYRGLDAASGDYMAWIAEAHMFGRDIAYAGLHDGDDLEDAYIATAVETVRRQLLAAGIRLARVVDENF